MWAASGALRARYRSAFQTFRQTLLSFLNQKPPSRPKDQGRGIKGKKPNTTLQLQCKCRRGKGEKEKKKHQREGERPRARGGKFQKKENRARGGHWKPITKGGKSVRQTKAHSPGRIRDCDRAWLLGLCFVLLYLSSMGLALRDSRLRLRRRPRPPRDSTWPL